MDQELAKIHKKIKNLFRRYRASLDFDELNVINETKALYKQLDKLNREMYLKLAKEAYKAVKNADNRAPGINKKWLKAFLLGYDPITLYVYEHEVDRKRARMAESVISSEAKMAVMITALNHWLRQTDQYAINVVDEATHQAYKDTDVEYGRWKTEQDAKVCSVCDELHDMVFKIDEAPEKQHYYCRCWLEPATEADYEGD